MSRMPYQTYSSPKSSPPVRNRRAHMREVFFITIALILAAGVMGGGYLLVKGTSFNNVLPQATPVPPLKPLTALSQIQTLYPAASVSFSHPLTDEVDLLTVLDGTTNAAPTPMQATQVISTYLRGYIHQPFWRWVDTNRISQTRTVYEMRPTELWIIATNLTFCTLNWTIYPITPQQLINRGVTAQAYNNGISSHPGSGPPPGNASGC